jgi:glycosyltransferase involved in cell wall biosynthesis
VKSRPVELTFVMPVYNEEGCVEDVVHSWTQCFADLGINYRILAVNDGSRDQSGTILNRLAVENSRLTPVHQTNGGHGQAVVAGYHQALILGTEWIFQTDSDNQFTPEDFASMWQKRNEFDFILGTRQSRQDPLHRLFISRILSHLISRVTETDIKDANCPFRLFHSNALRNLLVAAPTNAFAPNVFLSILAKLSSYRFMEMPVRHIARNSGKVSIANWRLIKACSRSVKELISFSLTLNERLQKIEEIRESESLRPAA